MVSRILAPEHRQEVLIAFAGVALHGLLSQGGTSLPPDILVNEAFTIAGEFLKRAEQVPG